MSYYLSDDLPVFLIGAFAKNQKANISPAERQEIAKYLRRMGDTYVKKGSRR